MQKKSLLTKQQRIALVIAVLFVGLLVALIVISGSGYVQVNNQGGKYSVKVLDSSGDEVVYDENVNGDYKKRLSSGEYSVVVSGDGNNIYNVAVEGFLKTTEIDNEFKPQVQRNILGYDPNGCITKINDVAHSFLCSGLSFNYIKHNPAKGKQPPYASTKQISGDLLIGTATDGNATVALRAEAYDGYKEYSLAIVGEDFKNVKTKDLDFLVEQASYNIKNYNNGFVIYSADPLEIYYYEKYNSKPIKVSANLDETSINGQYPSEISINSYGVLVLQAEQTEDYPDLEPTEDEEDTVYNYALYSNDLKPINNGSFEYRTIGYAAVCTSTEICILSGNKLSAYNSADFNTNKPIYSLNNVTFATDDKDQMLFVFENNLYRYDENGDNWYSLANVGDNRFCGIYGYQNNIMACLLNPQNGRAVVDINYNQTLNFAIEQKVNELYKNVPEIDTVSVYNDKVYVVTDNGELKFNEATSGYSYDPGLVKNNEVLVSQAFIDLGFNTAGYRLIMQDF